ncbi:MAG: serine/threonine protein kinase [Proteobacteria bacterium]|nr:serine/threonine protein kinase [Pseudomonadota bacterium]
MSDQLTRRFGPFCLLKRIGMGGMAETWLAIRQITKGVRKFVVLKCILPACNDDPGFIRLFYHEAAISLRLEHPNILHTWDCTVIEGRHVIVMEYLRGITLYELLQRIREKNMTLSPEIAAWIALQILSAFEYLHAYRDENGECLNIVHRDVTPHNIFVSYDGQCRLFDFGVARAGSPENDLQKGMLVGKLSYMSPEQCQGKCVDARSDLFSLAAVLYEMATNIAVFDRENDIRIIDALVSQPVQEPRQRFRDFPLFLSRIIMQGLEKSPERRYQNAAEFAADLRTFMKVGGYALTNHALRTLLADLYKEEIENLNQYLSTMELTALKENEPPSMDQLIKESHQVSDIAIGQVVDSVEIVEIASSKLSKLTQAANTIPEPDPAATHSDVFGRKKKWIFKS